MNFQKNVIPGLFLLIGGGILMLISSVPAAYAETEDVKVIERKPDPSNPLFETAEVEGGLFFRVPKDMTFVKQYGVVGPISSDEYCARKIDGVNGRIEALSKRIEALERNARTASNEKNQESL